MKLIPCLLLIGGCLINGPVVAEQISDETTQLPQGYIIDDLFIYMHAGPGANYRILGSINAGNEVSLTGNTDNDYVEVIDSKNRTAWVESKFVSTEPGLRAAVAELNAQLAAQNETIELSGNQLSDTERQLSDLRNKEQTLTNQINSLNKKISTLEQQVDNQDLEVKKEYFFNGAIVLGIGLLLGIVIPRLSPKKRSSMENWK